MNVWDIKIGDIVINVKESIYEHTSFKSVQHPFSIIGIIDDIFIKEDSKNIMVLVNWTRPIRSYAWQTTVSPYDIEKLTEDLYRKYEAYHDL